MGEQHLVVLVHGWGANSEDWWGSTRSAFSNVRRLQKKVEYYYHRYDTKQTPDWKVWSSITKLFGWNPEEQALNQLGEHLWSQLRQHSGNASSIALLGHSFGGLVVADAIRHGLKNAEVRDDDARILNAITAVALCCTPVAGAALADKYTKVVQLVGKNKHVLNLRKSSRERQDVVNAFLGYIQDNPQLLTLFRATGDAIVSPAEVTGPFENAGIPVRIDTLDGTHSDCVQNIGVQEKERKDNFDKLVRWLEASIPNASTVSMSKRDHYRQLLDELRAEVNEEPFRSWKKLREHSDVDDVYLLRIFLQRLVYVATRMHKKALGSANLWVAHYEGDGSLHLRSEEREGLFATDQLVVYLGKFGAGGGVTIRANQIHSDGDSISRNSAGARAFVTGKPELVTTATTRFNSRSDREEGVTHVLGVPLHSSREVKDMEVGKEIEGTPLAITIDFHFEDEPSLGEVEILTQGATEITALFKEFQQRWVDGRVRYKRFHRIPPPGPVELPRGG